MFALSSKKAGLLAVMLSVGGFAYAGPAAADAGSVAQSCKAGVDCAVVVNQELAGLTGTAAERDGKIADVVVAISELVDPGMERKRCRNLAFGVETAAAGVSDIEQRNRIIDIARKLCAQNFVTAAVDEDLGNREREGVPASAN